MGSPSELGHRHLATEVERLQREVGEESERQPGLINGAGLRWERDLRRGRLRGAYLRHERPRLRRRLIHVPFSLPWVLTQHTVEGLLVYHFDTQGLRFLQL